MVRLVLKGESSFPPLRQTKEIVAANVYNRAFTAGYTGGDGIVLCSTGHLNVAGGTYSNKIATDADLRKLLLNKLLLILLVIVMIVVS